MKKILFFTTIFLFTCLTVSAQRITRDYHSVPMSKVLEDMNKRQKKYTINFVYDELEDFRVSGSVHNQLVPAAIQQLIGFYPIQVKEMAGNILLVECVQKVPGRVVGRVIDENGQPVSYANVSLLSPSNSTFINGGVTTIDGNFTIPAQSHDLVLKVTYVGYKAFTRRLSSYKVGTIHLVPDTIEMANVKVKGLRKSNHIDHDVYTFTDEQIKNSRQSQELISTLPGLRIDHQSGTIATLSGKTLLILVNGIEVNNNQLKTIKPEQVRNVDYYNIPPARYASYGTVINIHTRSLNDGYAAGVDTQQGFGGFNNTNVYAEYNKGNSQFSFDYSLEYRNAGDCKKDQNYKLTHDNNTMQYDYAGNYHFGYANQDFNLRYLYTTGDSLNFQVKFTPNIFRWFWRDNYDITAEGNPQWTNGHSRQEQLQKSFGPSLDIYVDHIFSHNQQLTLDLVGTWYHNKQNNDNHQHDESGESILDDNMRQHNNKYSLIGEIAYIKNWDKVKLSFGYKATLAMSNFTISNVLSDYNDFKYSAHDDNHYAYAQVDGKLGKMEYRLSIGGTYVHTSNEATTYNKFYFTPQAVLSYPLKNGQITFKWESNPELASISQLSDNSTIIIPGYIRRGNPLLKSGFTNSYLLSYSFSSPYIDLTVYGMADYTRHGISNYYVWQQINGEDVVVSQPMNDDYELNLCGSTSIQLKPFKSELFVVSAYTGFVHQQQKSDIIGKHNNNYWPLTIQGSSRYKDWGAYIFWRRQTIQLEGPDLSSSENTANIGVYWQHKQFQVTVGCLFPFEAPHYKNYTLSNNILQRRSYNEISSQHGQVFIGVSWNIFSGKQKSINKKINNKDNDKGMF